MYSVPAWGIQEGSIYPVSNCCLSLLHNGKTVASTPTAPYSSTSGIRSTFETRGNDQSPTWWVGVLGSLN